MLTGRFFLVHQITLKFTLKLPRFPTDGRRLPGRSPCAAGGVGAGPLLGRTLSIGQVQGDFLGDPGIFWGRSWVGIRFFFRCFFGGAFHLGRFLLGGRFIWVGIRVFFRFFSVLLGSWWFQTWLDYFSIYWDVILTINIFHRGWNHQPDWEVGREVGFLMGLWQSMILKNLIICVMCTYYLLGALWDNIEAKPDDSEFGQHQYMCEYMFCFWK